MNLKSFKKIFLSSLLLFCMAITTIAQNKVVKGSIFETDGNTPVIGGTVLLKGTDVGTVTNVDGEYSIPVSGTSPILIFQYLGYLKQEVAVNNRTVVNVTLQEDVVQLQDVVVTALGLSREEKSLGYAISKVDNETLTKSVSGNWLNSMSGKVAGLNFDQANSGPSGSVRVTLRGDQSLNYGSNEALFVIDGVPVSSGMTATKSVSNYAQVDAPIDFGNAASDINPNDIESVSVLKGPAATALYGSRAANGAIVITTKSGRKTKGIGVTLNSSVTMEQAGYFPDFQTEYGNGSDMGLNEYSIWELPADMSPTGVPVQRSYSRYTFGEKFDPNKSRYLYSSKNWETGEFTKMPWVYQDDWYTGLFETGLTFSNTVTIDGSDGEGTSTRLSITDFRNEWILPNTGFDKQNISLSFNTKISDLIKFNAKVNYYKKRSDNMPGGGYNETNPMYALIWGFNVNGMDQWEQEYFGGRYNFANWSSDGKNGTGLVFPSSGSYNPYRSLYEELNSYDKDRLFGSLGLNFNLYKGLTFDLRSGLDWSSEFRTQRKPYYTTGRPKGFYREQTIGLYELNSDFLFTYNGKSLGLLNDKFGFTTLLGGNNMINQRHNDRITLDQLGEEGIYHTNNLPTGIIPEPYNARYKKSVNSLYGMASFDWDDTFFLDITGRNDWSSTLARGNWSYFYPSIATSILLDRVFNLSTHASWVDLMKLRLSWANVGNDTTPYSLDQYYGNSSYPGGYVLPGTITDPFIKPENVESWEAGLEGKFFKNRISFDVTVYKSSTTNQIVSVDMDQITGATGMKINAGEIQNKGLELAARIVPVKTKDFTWAFDLTWSKNKNKLVSLQEGWDPKEPLQTDMGTTIGSRTYVYSYVGEEMHVIYGRGFQRAPDGSSYLDDNGNSVDASGMHIVNTDGYPLLDESPNRKIGNVNPDWRAGMTQSFKYKNLSLSASFAGQWGGNTYSVTNFSLSYQGKLKNSLPGRYDGLVHEGVNAVKNPDGTFTYKKNNTVTNSIQTYYNSFIWNRDNTEMNTFDTSFLKLKEVRLDYDLPAKYARQVGFLQSASLGVYATNLFSWTNFPQYDPETGMLSGSDIYKGIETMAYPMTRSYGVNVKLSF